MRIPFQCCICKAVCWDPDKAENEEMWTPHDKMIIASHGICPRCLPGELEKVRRSGDDKHGVTLAS